MTSLGLIGLGALGWAVAERFGHCGFDLLVHSDRPEETRTAAKRGWVVAHSPEEVSQRCKAIVLCVTDTGATEEVVSGAGGLESAVSADHLIVDIGTTSPIATIDTARRLGDRVGSPVWVDAPVSGGPEAAAEGRLAMFVGGESSTVRRAAPILNALSTGPHRVGGVGCGQWMKVINQILVLDGLVVLAEAVIIARSIGIDPNVLPSVLGGGYGDSVLLQDMTGTMASRENLGAVGRLNIGAKDLSMILQLAADLGSPVPLTRAAHALYWRGMDMDLGEQPITSIVEVMDSLLRNEGPVPPGPSIVESGHRTKDKEV